MTTDTLRFNVDGEPKRYIGQHKFPEFDSTYYGSGTIISRIARKRPETLVVELLCWCSTLEELNQKEFELVNQYKTLSPRGYNLRPGGDQPGRISQELRDKISRRVKQSMSSSEVRRKISEANKRRSPQFYAYLSELAHTPSAIAKATQTKRQGIFADSTYREAARQRALSYYNQPGVREAHAAKIAAAKTSEVIEKQIAAIRLTVSKPEYREKQSRIQKEVSKRPEVFEHRSLAQRASMTLQRRANMSEAHKGNLATAETKRKMSETHKALIAKRLGLYKKLLSEGTFVGTWNDFQKALRRKEIIL